jgi:signal transduction histidine kinase
MDLKDVGIFSAWKIPAQADDLFLLSEIVVPDHTFYQTACHLVSESRLSSALIRKVRQTEWLALSPRRLLLLLTAGMLAAAWAGTAYWVLDDRKRIYRSATAELIGAIPLLKMHAHRSLDTAHTILVALDEAIQTGGEKLDLARLGTLALRMQSSEEDPIGIAVIDRRAQLMRIGSSDDYVDVSDRDYMVAMRTAAPGDFFVGRPIPSRVSGRAVIPMVMKMQPNASGVDAILAAIPAVNFEEAYRDLLISAPSSIGLLRQDGLVLHLTPDPNRRIGQILPGFDLATLQRQYAPLTAFQQDRTADLGLRITVSYAQVPSYPVVVAAAMRDAALELAWRQQAWPKVAGACAVSLVIVLLTLWLLALMARRDAALKDMTAALMELEAANRAKRDFMARMSHELRTPLNAILGFSEMISGAVLGPVSKTYQQYGRDIHRSGTHLLDMINQVLDITRIETGDLHPKPEPVEIDAVAAEVAMILRPLAEVRHVKLIFEFEADARRLLADPMMLRQMLLNLISNAVKFSPSGETVTVQSRADEDSVVVRVSDRGPGIDKDKLTHVFEPFGSGQSLLAQQAAGIGLGLPIAKKLVEMHGGRLTITTSRQKGTVVTLVFPPECRIAA